MRSFQHSFQKVTELLIVNFRRCWICSGVYTDPRALPTEKKNILMSVGSKLVLLFPFCPPKFYWCEENLRAILIDSPVTGFYGVADAIQHVTAARKNSFSYSFTPEPAAVSQLTHQKLALVCMLEARFLFSLKLVQRRCSE